MSGPDRDQVHELFADAALDRLTLEQELQLEDLVADGASDEKLSFELTAAELNLGLLSKGDVEPMPAAVRAKLEAAGRAWCAVRASGPIPLQRYVLGAGGTRRRLVTLSPWLAAAAGVTLAVFAWSPYSHADPIKLVERDPKKIEVPFALWADSSDPNCESKIGCVCWSEANQTGYLKLSKAFPCNDHDHQFQVWIIDERGEQQRVSGGTFDCKTGHDCRVVIHPEMRVHAVKSFAITMEKSGGMPVSDLSSKVAIATCGKKQ